MRYEQRSSQKKIYKVSKLNCERVNKKKEQGKTFKKYSFKWEASILLKKKKHSFLYALP